jgi:hypothetical protein
LYSGNANFSTKRSDWKVCDTPGYARLLLFTPLTAASPNVVSPFAEASISGFLIAVGVNPSAK